MTQSDPQPPARATEPSTAEQLGKLLQEAGATVLIGLRAQRKFDTVAAMLREAKADREIGAAIGWDGQTAVRWFALEAAEELAKQSATLSCVRALVEKWRDNDFFLRGGHEMDCSDCADELAAVLDGKEP